jgi:hypothetical protein
MEAIKEGYYEYLILNFAHAANPKIMDVGRPAALVGSDETPATVAHRDPYSGR